MAVLQGAEAKLYFGDFYGRPCIMKERFQKNYRHPILDKTLTNQRMKSEVRANLRCKISGKMLWMAVNESCNAAEQGVPWVNLHLYTRSQ